MDTTHSAIREALRDLHWPVIDTSGVPKFVDLLALTPRGRVILVECKTPLSKAGRVEMTESQERLQEQGWPLVVLASADQAIQFATEQAAFQRFWQGVG